MGGRRNRPRGSGYSGQAEPDTRTQDAGLRSDGRSFRSLHPSPTRRHSSAKMMSPIAYENRAVLEPKAA